MAKSETKSDTKSKAIHTERSGRLSVTVFENNYTREDGTTFKKFELKPERVYTDKEGALKNTSSFSIDDMLRIGRLSEKAIDVAMSKEAEASKQSFAERAQASTGAAKGKG